MKNDNPIEAIKHEVENLKYKPRKIGRLEAASANTWLEIGKGIPNPQYYFHRMIVQNEINIIFSAANTGKSLLLIQIAEDIARKEKVLVIDCELSTKQFQLRYTNLESGSVHVFPDNLMRAEINPELLDSISLEDAILDSVVQAAKNGIKVVCIDNMTFIILNAEKADASIKFMRKLIKLKKKYNLTLIIVAHTPKRNPCKPLTRDDLSGSSKLMALIDNAIAIGVSTQGPNMRYVKHVKFRNDEYPYPANNVAIYRIEKQDNYTKFVFFGYGNEKDHLREKTPATELEDMQEFVNLKAMGLTLEQIANETGFKKTTIHRKLKNAEARGIKATFNPASCKDAEPSSSEDVKAEEPEAQQGCLQLNDKED